MHNKLNCSLPLYDISFICPNKSVWDQDQQPVDLGSLYALLIPPFPSLLLQDIKTLLCCSIWRRRHLSLGITFSLYILFSEDDGHNFIFLSYIVCSLLCYESCLAHLKGVAYFSFLSSVKFDYICACGRSFSVSSS